MGKDHFNNNNYDDDDADKQEMLPFSVAFHNSFL